MSFLNNWPVLFNSEFLKFAYCNVNSKSSSFTSLDSEQSVEIHAITDKIVNSFKKVISLLVRPRTCYARFRRAPLTALRQDEKHKQLDSQQLNTCSFEETKVKVSAFKPFSPIQQVHRLPPLPHNHHQSKNNGVLAAKTAVSERNEAHGNIKFSSMTGETDSMHPSFCSLASSYGKPPLKKKCNSMDDAALKCGSLYGRCHCSKKRKLRVKKVIRVPAISNKMADIPPDDYS